MEIVLIGNPIKRNENYEWNLRFLRILITDDLDIPDSNPTCLEHIVGYKAKCSKIAVFWNMVYWSEHF